MIADFEMVIPSPRGEATEAFIKLSARQHYNAWVESRPRCERSDLRKFGKMWNELASQHVPGHLELERGSFRLSRDVARMVTVFDDANRHSQRRQRLSAVGSFAAELVAVGFAELASIWPSEHVFESQQNRIDHGVRYRSLVVWSNGVKAAERQCGLR